jgi:hypothetical protein
VFLADYRLPKRLSEQRPDQLFDRDIGGRDYIAAILDRDIICTDAAFSKL